MKKVSSLFLLCLFCTQVSAKVISPKEYLLTVETHYPKIISQNEKLKIAVAKSQKALGAFDSTLKAKRKQYIDSYYSTEYTDVSVERAFEPLNTKVSVGYRKGVGNIPVYDGDVATDNIGEFYASLSLSLLRYRSIDSNRYGLWKAKNEEKIASYVRDFKKIDVLVKSNNTYWKWYFYYYKKELYELLVKLSSDRLNSIKKRVKKNDLARIYLVEANQYLLSFRRELVDVNARLSESFAKLKVYYPNATLESRPIVVPKNKIKRTVNYNISNILEKRPELEIYQLMVNNSNLELAFAKQKLMPKLNFELQRYEARDKKSPYYDENKVGLSFEIPIERNLGKGAVAAARSKLRSLKLEKQLIKRELRGTLDALNARIEGDIQAFNILIDEQKAAKRLQKAEWSKFKSGMSDIFILNARDANYAKARLKTLEKIMDFEQSSYIMSQWSRL
jgi:outer membrane protein TolC